MATLQASIASVEEETLKGTKNSLKTVFEIAAAMTSDDARAYQEKHTSAPAKYLVALVLCCTYLKEEKYIEALALAKNTFEDIGGGNSRILDGIVARLWGVARIASSKTGEDMLEAYMLALAINREYKNTESITVLINAALLNLKEREMYDEAYTFLKHTKLPEGADVGESSVFYYLSSIVYLMAGEYATAEKTITQAIVKSTNTAFTLDCRKVYVLASMHQGKHPNRSFFQTHHGLEHYQKVLLSIKSCSLEIFYQAAEDSKDAFKSDGLWQAVLRLEGAVQKEHVRRIGTVYSKISLGAIAQMLGVSEESAVFLLQKALSEGVIAGFIDTEAREYVSTEKSRREQQSLKIEEMLGIANTLTMLKKHEEAKKKTLEEMKTDMAYNEYQM
ncbi:26S proteasome regulatory subunit N3 [Nematocida displodere]|uniref:26S proteasome regulatory subunit N3 n=1 Tax=Nematocida displodere TaxID=1805483 RepID=A0A177EBF9_9MICR|nr:26S proteasome regulatory subunit N3 [Nematocida displodere]